MSSDSRDANRVLEWREAIAAPFLDHWREILRARIPFYATLASDERQRFEDRVKVFVYTKTFSSVDLPSVSEEMKVVIAATACRLTMNMPGRDYGHLRHVIVRGGPFRPFSDPDNRTAIGTASAGGVTLSWPHVIQGLAGPDDGDNVGFHEFAHVLDGADGTMDGIAPSHRFSLYEVWSQVVSEGQAVVRRAAEVGEEAPIDAYAAKSEVEFFAVATEWFFERPAALRDKLPAVYDLLAGFYDQDPLTQQSRRSADAEESRPADAAEDGAQLGVNRS